MQTLNLRDYDLVFLSYQEPNAESNYQHLLDARPDALRVHGVKGSDAAHKACAELSQTDRLIIVDGDTRVDPAFWDTPVHVPPDIDLSKAILSWSSYNPLNGLAYGNGGVKSWPKQVALDMKTHELADPGTDAKLDFCWVLEYVLMPGGMGETLISATSDQAWRAGYREGAKLSLINGQQYREPDWVERMPQSNLERLRVWATVGMDNPNGIWAILGARAGCWAQLLGEEDTSQIQDFDYLNSLWVDMFSTCDPYAASNRIARDLNQGFNVGIPETPLGTDQSLWFKSVYKPHKIEKPRRLK